MIESSLSTGISNHGGVSMAAETPLYVKINDSELASRLAGATCAAVAGRARVAVVARRRRAGDAARSRVTGLGDGESVV